MIGPLLSHCRITVKLGVGGIGEVYHAWDTRLNRQLTINDDEPS
jgi:hypothetical protein